MTETMEVVHSTRTIKDFFNNQENTARSNGQRKKHLLKDNEKATPSQKMKVEVPKLKAHLPESVVTTPEATSETNKNLAKTELSLPDATKKVRKTSSGRVIRTKHPMYYPENPEATSETNKNLAKTELSLPDATTKVKKTSSGRVIRTKQPMYYPENRESEVSRKFERKVPPAVYTEPSMYGNATEHVCKYVWTGEELSGIGSIRFGSLVQHINSMSSTPIDFMNWEMEVVRSKKTGSIDVLWYNPDGKKFRSRAAIAEYLGLAPKKPKSSKKRKNPVSNFKHAKTKSKNPSPTPTKEIASKIDVDPVLDSKVQVTDSIISSKPSEEKLIPKKKLNNKNFGSSWSAEEEASFIQQVAKVGINTPSWWKEVEMPGRSRKAILARYYKLMPRIKKFMAGGSIDAKVEANNKRKPDIPKPVKKPRLIKRAKYDVEIRPGKPGVRKPPMTFSELNAWEGLYILCQAK